MSGTVVTKGEFILTVHFFSYLAVMPESASICVICTASLGTILYNFIWLGETVISPGDFYIATTLIDGTNRYSYLKIKIKSE